MGYLLVPKERKDRGKTKLGIKQVQMNEQQMK
jgi:hypothetical protein